MNSAYVTVPDAFALKNVQLTAAGEEAAEFKTYDNIEVTFEMEFLKEMKDVTFAFSVRDQVDDVVVSASKLKSENLLPVGKKEFQCCIEKNRFREGIYNIGFYASDHDGGSLYKSHNVATFTILADMELIKTTDALLGFVVMETTWKEK
ncbi:MAG: hypothetical protein GY757_48805, partial [bacterium]|nr:hypothetical protein [bacterium]